MNWKSLLAYITGSVDQKLLLHNEFLVTESDFDRPGGISGWLRTVGASWAAGKLFLLPREVKERLLWSQNRSGQKRFPQRDSV
jgi:hypothetical protein